jgi:hypothetical protein
MAKAEMLAHWWDDLFANPHNGVKRAHGILEDHPYFPAAHSPELVLGQLQRISAAQQDPTSQDLARSRQQSQQ